MEELPQSFRLCKPGFFAFCIINKTANEHTCIQISVNGRTSKQVSRFKYLGTVITSTIKDDVKTRTIQVKQVFKNLKSFICNKSVRLRSRSRVLKAYNLPFFAYNSATRTTMRGRQFASCLYNCASKCSSQVSANSLRSVHDSPFVPTF